MNNSLKSLDRIDDINSIPQILSTLRKLDAELSNTSLANLKPFNHTYLIITKNINTGIQNGDFKHKQEVEQLIINFVYYYFKSLKNHQDKYSVTKAWEIAFRFCTKRQTNRLMYLAIGANAHINNDLSFALKNTIKNPKFYADYQKIGEVIEISLEESILWINKNSFWLSFIDQHLIPIYQLIIKFLLKQWRKAAWNNYLKLLQKNNISSQIKSVAKRKAEEIFLISYLIPY